MSEQDIEQIINIINKDINQSINKNLITYFKKVDYNISLLTAIKSVLFKLPEYIELQKNYNELQTKYLELKEENIKLDIEPIDSRICINDSPYDTNSFNLKYKTMDMEKKNNNQEN